MSNKRRWGGPINGKLAAKQCLARWIEEHNLRQKACKGLPRGETGYGLWVGDGFVAYGLQAGKDQQDADERLRADGIKRNVEPNDVLTENIPLILAGVPQDAPERTLTRLALRWDETWYIVLFAGADGFDMADARFLAPLDDTSDNRWRWRQATKGGPIVGAFRGDDVVILMPMHLANGMDEGEALWDAWKATQGRVNLPKGG